MEIYQVIVRDGTEGRDVEDIQYFLEREHAVEFAEDTIPGMGGHRRKWENDRYGRCTLNIVPVHEASIVEDPTRAKRLLAKELANRLSPEELAALAHYGLDTDRLDDD